MSNHNNKPYYDSSPSSSTSSRTFRKNSTQRPIQNVVGGNIPSLVNSHVTINNTNVTHQNINTHPRNNNIHQCQYDPDHRTMTTSSGVIPNINNNNLLNISNQNAPGHVRFTSASNAASSVASYSSSQNVTHPKSILRRKNLDSSSNVMTSSNQTTNHNNGWDTQG